MQPDINSRIYAPSTRLKEGVMLNFPLHNYSHQIASEALRVDSQFSRWWSFRELHTGIRMLCDLRVYQREKTARESPTT